MNKNVLIIDNFNDASVNDVIEYIAKEGGSWQRVSFSELFKQIQDFDFSRENEIAETGYTTVWFRNNGWQKNKFDQSEILENDNITSNLSYDFSVLKEAFSSFIPNRVKQMSSYQSFYLNKLVVLNAALKCGLLIPCSLVCNNKKSLNEFMGKHKTVICKSIGENIKVFFNNASKALVQYVEEVNEENMDIIPDFFSHTLFQQKIEKAFDLRVFFLDGKFYSMAIFSHCLDYREDYHNHRNIPFKLPLEIENKLTELMSVLGLNTGSIDMVRCKETGAYYFLEVNPNGQFGMVSKPCNYYLEKEIAKFLTSQ